MTDRIYINNCSSDEVSTSMSLSAMVEGFIEGECEVITCGRARCTCSDGTSNEGRCLFDTRDGKRFSENLPDALEALILSIGNAERNLSDTVRTLIRKINETACICGATNWSNNCLRWSLMNELRVLGYNAAVCKSKWDPAAGYPGGVYEYLDVVTTISTNSQKKVDRVIVDIEFLEHFEIARPTRLYRAMLNKLPSMFVGRPDNLQKIVTIMCDAAKGSLNERNMHLPPWRKSEYMEAKWFSTYSRISNESDHLYETQTKASTIFAVRELNTHPRLIESEATYRLAETMTARRILRKTETENCKLLEHSFEHYETKKSSKIFDKTPGGVYELTVISTDWEPPPVQPKASHRFRKVAGLAAVLGKADASVQDKEQKNVAPTLILPEKCREDLSSAEMWSMAKPRNMQTRRTWMHSNVALLPQP